jgi:hypothetical protein
VEDSPTETRICFGETGAQACELRYTKEFDEVCIVLDHQAHVSPSVGPLVVMVKY